MAETDDDRATLRQTTEDRCRYCGRPLGEKHVLRFDDGRAVHRMCEFSHADR